jgi:ketosteroid isomerase-like protein
MTLQMNENQNIQTIQQCFDAFGRGDIPFIVNNVTLDVKWSSYTESAVPWSGDHSGKDGVPGFFQAIYDNVDVQGFEPTDYVAQGDTVVSAGTFACTANSTGKSANTKWVFVFKFRDGLVSSYEQFNDPGLAAIFN